MVLSRAYSFEVTVHQILAELCPFENFVNVSFLAYSSYSLHPNKLKLDLLWFIDHDVEQRIVCGGYSPPNISRAMSLWKFL